MNRKLIELNPDSFPKEIQRFLRGATVYDSSCSPDARVVYIDKDGGLFVKEAASGTLKTEASMTAYMHSLNLSAEVLYYGSHEGKDYLVTRRIRGEDCIDLGYLNDPVRLCDTLASLLRQLHEIDPKDCPVQDRNLSYVESVRRGIWRRSFESDLFAGLFEFESFDEARRVAEEGFPLMKRDALLHGDYCLPNIILDDWKFSGFIDVGNGGIGDRHIDVLWGIWTFNFNLGTFQYTDRFLDVYGRDKVEPEMLRHIAAMEMIGG